MRILPALYCNLFRKICLLKSREASFHYPQKRTAYFLTRMGNYISNATDQQNGNAVKLIEETISNNCVVIFSKTSCPYCTMAKEAFDDISVSYKAIELDQIENGSHLQSALHGMTGARTVPRVFVNGTCIGGGTETRKLNQEGKLLQLVQQCNLTATQS
ncbi:glutaredoxin 2 isoform X2 [Rana temporaria]|uniref:glutaredoxin 2 isoform X2 n=1 Tax=Rana temporaria TaxID=8407 RepID=UPI001AACD291|nr:glutaredoxin 2 isoform X2 [Rana temporaria]XP_040215743.1 glutaredoxin 2 isoform X2 [Rana temporaria]XP_040215744.1 glutaredoxin 2 isoform X2 [Rana temporaria]